MCPVFLSPVCETAASLRVFIVSSVLLVASCCLSHRESRAIPFPLESTQMLGHSLPSRCPSLAIFDLTCDGH
ncbi:hypothetical protein F5Y08DRAFT_269463 [Xylaria arbuscula]|nr:hypothetical protein F5Y08DRAFT_269463 [Xylaria arbuscula]